MNRPLPAPNRKRWQPLRAGLVDLFYYDAEEFWFHDGRLLLRGNNGTGKSKVLALMLPFLLDGELSPHRVEPDADPKKRMEWNLLLGGAHPFPERLGYTWLEFGRLADDGTPEFRTLGCGMKAVSGRGIARHWFFVTSLRPGAGLEVVDATGTALPRDRLADALGTDGTVFETARAYRRAVDEALFGLGEQRYGALVDLLVQLRQPQLSKRPSEKALSDALTEALPPLDQAVLADVAEAFRSLEEDRSELDAMTRARTAATTFLGHYRRYARIAARRRSALVRRAQSAYESVNAGLRDAEARYTAAETRIGSVDERLGALDLEGTKLRARDEALRASPEMRSQLELTRAAEKAAALAKAAERAARQAVQSGDRMTTAAAKQARVVEELAAELATVAAARVSTQDAADAGRVGRVHREQVDAHLDGADDRALARLRTEADTIATRQEGAVRHVEGLVTALAGATEAVTDARGAVASLADDAVDLAERREAAEAAVSSAGAELVAATRGHFDGLTELTVADPAGALAALELWVHTQDGANPGRAAVEAAGHDAARRHASEEARLDQVEDTARTRRAGLATELAALEAGEDTAPPAPYTRDPAARAHRAGAPLWRLTDFAPAVSDADRAGLEAALEAAGILDAWVSPDGVVTSADTNDVLVRATTAPRPTRGLTGALVPAVDRDEPGAAAVADETVTAVLAAIGLGEHEHGETWVAQDGRFGLGVLSGRWSKDAAEYVGRGAREASRRQRIAFLQRDIAAVDAELAGYAEERAALARRRSTAAGEVAAVPGDDAVRNAHADVLTLAREHDKLGRRQAEADQTLSRAVHGEQQARRTLAETAAELDLPDDRASLGEVAAALNRYRVEIAGLWPAVRSVRETRRRAAELAAEVAAATAENEDDREHAVEATTEAEAADERHRTLRATVGTAVAELQRQLGDIGARLRRVGEENKTAARERDGAVDERGKASGLREQLTEQLRRATDDRAAETESMRRFGATGLLTVALPDLAVPDPADSWAPTPTVVLARQLDSELADVADDDNTWDRAQRRVTDELKTLTDTLASQGNTASARLQEDGIVVDVVFRGRALSVPELAEALAVEVADRQRLLDERERVVLENHLVNEVASTLQDLITEAERQVATMNSELADRPTSTGMRLRLVWRPREDGPAGLDAARERLLRQTADAWSESDRAAVGEFLQARIADVRLRDPSGTWLEHLTAALDYRAWNRFVIQRHQNGQWRSATGPASGGERVLAASVPLFAAASAHYESAGNPHAPRLVTLDEAFAGVDDNARAKYLGLLAAFDLDVVMTSEREWGCYPEVPGLSIAQLSRTDDVAAVLVTNWRWDGRSRTEQPRPHALPAATPAAPAASVAAQQQEGPWGADRP
ncbi:MAG: TIGR02680 family protein [Actinophytocola sp.]|uniref:TIGR02680 family protein n=1 Tax=Actinophytocola sp. TaxID=1872138 RepID=UPI00132A8570|nr:TIGR02680 family protein [Actinophytocola sp.]MPZ82193.1 TIGR02680 family protein [Actinophytocola sp.]